MRKDWIKKELDEKYVFVCVYEVAVKEFTGLGLFDVSSISDIMEQYEIFLGEQG